MARQFNGSSDLIDLSSVALTPNNAVISLSAWIKSTATGGSYICSDNGSGGGRFCQFRHNANKLNLILFQSSTVRQWTSTTSVNTGAWVHVGASYDLTTGILYVNGIAEGTANLTATNGSDNHNWRLGAQIPGVTQLFFNGSLAECAIWKRALSAGEFAALAGGAKASEFDPVHYWPLWGTDSPEPDLGSG